MNDFIKIFKNDKVSENLVKIINNEVLQAKHQESLSKPSTTMGTHPSMIP